MRPALRDRVQIFTCALHGALALELARLAADGDAFERFWQRPRRTGLRLAASALATAAASALASWPPLPRP